MREVSSFYDELKNDGECDILERRVVGMNYSDADRMSEESGFFISGGGGGFEPFHIIHLHEANSNSHIFSKSKRKNWMAGSALEDDISVATIHLRTNLNKLYSR